MDDERKAALAVHKAGVIDKRHPRIIRQLMHCKIQIISMMRTIIFCRCL